LRAKFPSYGYRDMVEAQRRMLSEHLQVNHLRLLMGTSMGCMHIYVWAERHRDFLDAAMPLACQPTQIVGRNLFFRQLEIHAIREDPSYHGGDYTENPPAARTAGAIVSLLSGNPLTWQKDNPTRDDGIQNYDKTIERRVADANDMLYAVDSSWDYNPAPDLAKIHTPILHINFADDPINPPELHVTDEL